MSDDRQGTHVFVSYVRENKEGVERLCDELKRYGVNVWLDRRDIEPGARWQDAVREAIRSGSFFIACFSQEYYNRDRTFMNEEIVLAIEELRLRPNDRIWFIPVLLSECGVPAFNIGGGATLRSIQWVKLYNNWDAGIHRILDVIRPVPKEVQRLIEALSADNPRIRESAASGLGEICDPRSVPALIKSLKDEEATVRRSAAFALSYIRDSQSVPALIPLLSDEDGRVRAAAAHALANIADPRSVSALIKALSDENPQVRIYTAEALAHIRDARAVTALAKALYDMSDRVSRNAAMALRMIGTPEALEAVEEYEKGKGG